MAVGTDGSAGTLRVLWMAMLIAVGAYWVVYRVVPIHVDESRFILAAQVRRWLPVVATALSIAAFVVYRSIPAADSGTALPRYVLCWAIAEAIGVTTLAFGIGLGVTGLDLFFVWAAAALILLRPRTG